MNISFYKANNKLVSTIYLTHLFYRRSTWKTTIPKIKHPMLEMQTITAKIPIIQTIQAM